MTDDEKARAERARRLREEIGRRAKHKPAAPRPRTPHEFVEEQMRELDEKSRQKGEGGSDEPPPPDESG